MYLLYVYMSYLRVSARQSHNASICIDSTSICRQCIPFMMLVIIHNNIVHFVCPSNEHRPIPKSFPAAKTDPRVWNIPRKGNHICHRLFGCSDGADIETSTTCYY